MQFWYKFLPAVSGEGFDAGPFLVTLHQTMKPESCEKVDGKLVLRDLPGTPVADLPVLQQEGARLMMISTDYYHVLEDVEIDPDGVRQARPRAVHVTTEDTMSQATDDTGHGAGIDAQLGMAAMYDLAAPQARYLEIHGPGRLRRGHGGPRR